MLDWGHYTIQKTYRQIVHKGLSYLGLRGLGVVLFSRCVPIDASRAARSSFMWGSIAEVSASGRRRASGCAADTAGSPPGRRGDFREEIRSVSCCGSVILTGLHP